MKQLLLMLTIMCLVSGCMNGMRPQVGPPWMQKLFTQGPKSANPLFTAGWKDGCETGISTTANALQRQFYKFKQDPEKAQMRDYYIGWRTAYWYCARYTMQYLRRQII